MTGDAMPAVGVPAEQILAELTALRAADLPTHGGRLFAYVYDSGRPDVDSLAASAHALSANVNGLDPTAFPSLLATENAVVAATARLLSAPQTVVGNVTSGGTESLLLAVKAARDARPDITEPRLVIPASAHAAFAKASSFLRVGLDVVPVSPVTLQPSTSDIAAAIGPSTVLVAVSAPAYPHGVVDPVDEVAELAAAQGIRCHVDACFGGFVLPYLRRLGVPVPPFDFAVPGVTSISVDLHKYGYTPKGVSVLLHRDRELRRPQYFAWADWPGYPMVNPVVASTRSGGPIAAAYAVLRHIGDDGYLTLASSTWDAVRGLAAAVSTVDGLALMVEPQSTVVAFRSTDPALDLFVLGDELAARGWHTQTQFAHGGIPASIRLSITASVAPRVEEFAVALADSAAAARAAGPVEVPPLDLGELTPELVASLATELGLAGASGGSGPPRMAAVNAILAAAPPRMREWLLVEFLSLLQSNAA